MANEKTAAEYIASAEKTGVDKGTSFGISSAIAHAGKAWSELPADQKTAEKAYDIASKAVSEEKMFLPFSGTQALVEKYNEQLIERTYKLDKEQKVEHGTNLKSFLDGVAKAVHNIDFDEVKKGNLKGVDLAATKKEISEAAHKHVGLNGTVEQDLIKTVKDNPEAFKDVKVTDAKLNMNLLKLAAVYAAALLKGKPKDEEHKKEEPQKDGKSGALDMRSLEDILAKVAGMDKEAPAPYNHVALGLVPDAPRSAKAPSRDKQL